MTTLTRESAKRLIEFRLNNQKEIADLQQKDPKRGALWPFTWEGIEQIVPPEGLPARDLIRRARHRFDELKQEITIKPPPPPEEAISQHWNELFEKQLQQPEVRLDEGVYEDGLLRLLQTKPPRGWRVHRGTERDIHVLLEGQKEKTGKSVSNSENMTSLARHLGRLQAMISSSQVNRLIFLRDARLPIKPTATVTQRRLQDLVQKGMQVLRPPAEAYASLNVLRELWNKAAENDLSIGDSSMSMGQLKSWLVKKTPRPLQELIDACQGITISPLDELIDKLIETLKGQWMVLLKDAAQKMALRETDLAQLVIEKPEVAGLLSGPPMVLFLNPEAVNRT
ncbi:MAG: hypothetical protein HY882_12540 [Deltaproteobacteria bacterium]|nr:hypothetical protein [Deltaproteobacteria bacterium]